MHACIAVDPSPCLLCQVAVQVAQSYAERHFLTPVNFMLYKIPHPVIFKSHVQVTSATVGLSNP